jgi:hypothetical protein
MEAKAAPSLVLSKHGAPNPIGLQLTMASSLTVTLNLVQGQSVKMAPVDLVPWMLKQVQQETIVVTS